jgi:sterol desaturase/sphingolipid hydroxylase (fatty acid hydroxylase superfamily)
VRAEQQQQNADIDSRNAILSVESLQMKKSLFILVGLGMLSLLGYVVGVYFLSAMVSHFPAVGPFVFVDTHGTAAFSLRTAALQPAAFITVVAGCLAFDAVCLGLEESSLKRLLDNASASTRVDLFYTVLRLIGGFNVLVFIFSFGTLFWFVNQIHRVLHISFLQHVHSYVIQFALICLINTFIGYWAHRLMHTRWLWEIHKVHHAAEEMNIVTTFRNHPIEQLIMSVLNAFPVALLGGASPVIIAYYAVNMVYQSMAHSEINLKGKLWDIIWITPAAHRIHHSKRTEHFDRNFGVLTVWDYLFGTYMVPSTERLTYGVDGGETFNRPQYLIELFDNVRRWVSPARGRSAAAISAQSPSPAPVSPSEITPE